jgi:hypothetical protein
VKSWIKGLVVVLGLILVMTTGADAEIEEDEKIRDVIINEVMWMGSVGDGNDEWIELKNMTDEVIDLAGCEIVGAGSGTGSISLTGEVKENGFYVLAKKAAEESALADGIANQVTLESPKMSLTNSGEQLELRCEEIVLDKTPVEVWPAGDDGTVRRSMERNRVPDDGEIADNWHTAYQNACGGEGWKTNESNCGTPGGENSVNVAPQAVVVGPEEGWVDEELAFSGEDSSDEDGDALEYAWSCGNGETGEGEEMKCVFSEPGKYVVGLTVSDGFEEDEERKEIVIRKLEYSDEIVFSEVFPNPKGDDKKGEFVEVYNQGNEEVDLSGWQLKYDSLGYVIEDRTIKSKAYLVWEYNDSRRSLKNSGSVLELISPDGEVKHKVEYGVVPEGWSWARNEKGEWSETTTVTKGAKNEFTEPEQEEDEEEDQNEEEESVDQEDEDKKVAGTQIKVVAIKDLRSYSIGEKVEIEGVVSVAPGSLGERVMYLAGSGVQVYSYNGFPELVIGDRVKLTGEIGQTAGETRIKLSASADVIKTSNDEAPEPHGVKTGEVKEDKEGWLVRVSGKVAQTSGNTFYVDDGSGEVKIYINSNTGIDKPKMSKGMVVTITGVVSQTASGYRILPRFQDDVRVGEVEGMSSFPEAGQKVKSVSEAMCVWLVMIVIGLLGWGYVGDEPMWRIGLDS